MIELKNIQSLTSFKRNTAESLERLKGGSSPLILTVNGKAELVVMNAENYQEMINQAQDAETIRAINRGIEAFEKGEFLPAREALGELKAKYEI